MRYPGIPVCKYCFQEQHDFPEINVTTTLSCKIVSCKWFRNLSSDSDNVAIAEMVLKFDLGYSDNELIGFVGTRRFITALTMGGPPGDVSENPVT